MGTDLQYRDQTGGFISAAAFKMPIRNVQMKELEYHVAFPRLPQFLDCCYGNIRRAGDRHLFQTLNHERGNCANRFRMRR